MHRLSEILVFGSVLLIAFATGPAVVADEEQPGPGSGSQAVIDDVMRMLNEGVGSQVIADWLNRGEKSVPPLSPDDVIELTRAGATDELVELLIEMSAPGEGKPQPEVETTGIEPPAVPADGTAGVAFSFVYRSQSDDGEEVGKRWAMFAYLDGELLTWSKSSGTFSLKSVNTSRRISPGPHVIRLVRESHKPRGKKRWDHESLVCPDPVVFQVETGDGWHMAISWVEPAFSLKEKRPLSWRLTRWDVDVAGLEKTGVRKEEWRHLCEDAEANVPEGKKPPTWVRQQLDGCVKWSSLWSGEDPVATRAELLEAHEKDNFRPPRD